MVQMELIRSEITPSGASKGRVALQAERGVLAKRRWRGTADDGREFGFDLTQPIGDGAVFFEADGNVYYIVQQPEPLLEIACADAAKQSMIAWMTGNLHFPIEIRGNVLRAPDDPAVRGMLARERVEFVEVNDVFHPLKAMANHGH